VKLKQQHHGARVLIQSA